MLRTKYFARSRWIGKVADGEGSGGLHVSLETSGAQAELLQRILECRAPGLIPQPASRKAIIDKVLPASRRPPIEPHETQQASVYCKLASLQAPETSRPTHAPLDKGLPPSPGGYLGIRSQPSRCPSHQPQTSSQATQVESSRAPRRGTASGTTSSKFSEARGLSSIRVHASQAQPGMALTSVPPKREALQVRPACPPWP